MNIQLEKFGWDGLIVPTELHSPLSLPTINHLKIMRPQQNVSGTELYYPYDMFQNNNDKFLPAYIIGEKINGGGYATILKARRAVFKPDTVDNKVLVKSEHFSDACIKNIHINLLPEEEEQTPVTKEQIIIDEINAILYEAYIHALILQTFKTIQIPNAVPQLFEIVARTKTNENTHKPEEIESIWIVMELLKGLTLEKYLSKVLKKFAYAENDKIIIDILIQICTYLHFLQELLQFNHRDMKINNIYIRLHETGWTNELKNVPSFGTWKCKVDAVLIDFGFACIACGPSTPHPHRSLLSAGSWFRPEHDCMKYGRDLAQLLYSLHVHFPIHVYFSTSLCAFLHSVCIAKTASGSINILKGIDKEGNHSQGYPRFTEGIYKFLRNNNTDVIDCRPSRFLQGLHSLKIHT